MRRKVLRGYPRSIVWLFRAWHVETSRVSERVQPLLEEKENEKATEEKKMATIKKQ